METIKKSYLINSDIDSVWDCLTNPEQMNKWGAQPSNFDLKVGGDFNMWGDYLTGRVTDFANNEFLEEDWTVEGMSEPSKVRFELAKEGDTTTVKLVHSNVPDGQRQELDYGWDEYYLGQIRDYLESKDQSHTLFKR